MRKARCEQKKKGKQKTKTIESDVMHWNWKQRQIESAERGRESTQRERNVRCFCLFLHGSLSLNTRSALVSFAEAHFVAFV